MIDITKIKENIASLPPFNATILRARELLSDSEVSVKKLTEIFKYDAGVTTNILKVCNSAYYGPKVPITNLQQAIVYIGQKELKEILVISGILHYFDDYQPGFEGSSGELLRHSIATAVLCKELGTKLNINNEILFVAGILHDVGKIVLSKYVKDKYSLIIETITKEQIQFHQAEDKIIGINHAEVGKVILEEWNFPPEIVSATSNHHIVKPDIHNNIDLIVALADRLTNLMGAGTLNDGLYYEGFTQLCNYFDLHLIDVEKILAEGVKKIVKVFGSFEKNAIA